MKLTEHQTAELYREMTARRERGPHCLDDDLLVRAGANDLGARERETVAAHIAGCSDCAREYRIARSMRTFDTAARAELRSPIPVWPALAVAAVIALVVFGFIWQNDSRSLRRELVLERQALASARKTLAVERSRPKPVFLPPAPQIAVPIVDLDADSTRGAASAPMSIALPMGTNQFTLILHLPGDIRTPAQIEIEGAKGVIWRDTLQRFESGAVTLSLHRDFAPPGDYSVTVRSGKAKAKFAFRVL
jgi:hypothetical protein